MNSVVVLQTRCFDAWAFWHKICDFSTFFYIVWIWNVFAVWNSFCSLWETWRTVICNHKCVQKKWNSLDALEGNSLAGFFSSEELPFICDLAVGKLFKTVWTTQSDRSAATMQTAGVKPLPLNTWSMWGPSECWHCQNKTCEIAFTFQLCIWP